MNQLDAIFDELCAPEGDAHDGGTVRQQVVELVHFIAEAGGTVMLDDLAGWDPAVVRAALEADPNDKRRRAYLRGGRIEGVRMIWLASSGWQLVGKPSRREHRPGGAAMRHRLAVRAVRQTVERLADEIEIHGVFLRALTARAEVEPIVRAGISKAWGSVRVGGAAGEDAGRLLEGIWPDLIVIESWPRSQTEKLRKMWAVLGATAEQEPELTVAVEVQLADRGALLDKVRSHGIAQRLGWWHATVWLTDSAIVAERLRRCGVGGAPDRLDIDHDVGVQLVDDSRPFGVHRPISAAPGALGGPQWWITRQAQRLRSD